MIKELKWQQLEVRIRRAARLEYFWFRVANMQLMVSPGYISY
jgi:hypothetical protein